jgi:2,5-diketo-D-gluconate reductase A
LGGRGIDTALTYGDVIQQKVARALATTDVPRSDIFVTTKVPCCPLADSGKCKQPEYSGSIAQDISKDIAILGKVDLLLLHWPCDTYQQTLDAYTALEAALTSGVTRARGVSNFNASLLERLSKDIKVKPAVNQCGHSVGAHHLHNPKFGGDDLTVEYCAKHGISYSAYSPLGGLNGLDIYKNPTVISIANVHKVSPAQVALKWLVQQNITVVTASNNSTYDSQDKDLFSFTLTKAEMKTLAAL